MQNEQLLRFKNPVLLKDEDGKTKPSTFDLPPASHTYGKKVVDDPEPMKHVVNGWQQSQNSAKPPSKIKNFQELNRQAVHGQAVTAKDQSGFRKTRDIMVEAKEGQRVIPIMLPEEEFTYGVGNRPSTPMKLVMGNCYALDAESHKEANYNTQVVQGEAQKGKKVQAKKTKSQALREQQAEKEKQYRNKPNTKEEFKLNKFSSTNTKVDTRLSKQ